LHALTHVVKGMESLPCINTCCQEGAETMHVPLKLRNRNRRIKSLEIDMKYNNNIYAVFKIMVVNS